MQAVDYSKPIEVVTNTGAVVAAEVRDWNGAGAPPIWTQGALFSVTENMLRRLGHSVRNVSA